MSQKRFEFLDGLRGVAALLVVLFHLNFAIHSQLPNTIPEIFDKLFSLGYLGVQIFFVLSGFVIAYSLRNSQMSLPFLGRFFIRRSVRLDPSYWTVIALTLLIALAAQFTFKSGQPFPFEFSQVIYNIFYLPDLVQVPLIIPVAWTLCIEFQFYMFFAFLLLLFDKFNLSSRTIQYVWTALIVFSILQNTDWATLPTKPVTFIPHWYSFFLGCLTCWAFLGRIDREFLLANYALVAVCSLGTSTPHAIVSLGMALLIYFVGVYGKMNLFLKRAFFQYTGKISYSLYLIHWPVGMKLVGMCIRAGWSSISVLMISLTVTVIVADIFYRLVEWPSHRLSRRLFSVQHQLTTEQ